MRRRQAAAAAAAALLWRPLTNNVSAAGRPSVRPPWTHRTDLALAAPARPGTSHCPAHGPDTTTARLGRQRTQHRTSSYCWSSSATISSSLSNGNEADAVHAASLLISRPSCSSIGPDCPAAAARHDVRSGPRLVPFRVRPSRRLAIVLGHAHMNLFIVSLPSHATDNDNVDDGNDASIQRTNDTQANHWKFRLTDNPKHPPASIRLVHTMQLSAARFLVFKNQLELIGLATNVFYSFVNLS